MAGCDYYSCDKCGAKTFYDAALHYEDDGPRNTLTNHPWPVGVGDMAVLCGECAKTSRVSITEREGGEG